MASTRLALAAALVVPLAACGSGSGSSSSDVSSAAYYRALEDDDATARDVVEVAGSAYDVAVAEQGYVLALFRIEDQEGGEATKTAWRLLGPDRAVVREELGTSFLQAEVVDGEPYLVDAEADVSKPPVVDRVEADGTLERLSAGPTTRATRPGDVLVGDAATAAVIRPESDELLPLDGTADARLAGDSSTGQVAALTPTDDAVNVAVTPDGPTQAIRPEGGGYPLQLAAGFGTVAVAFGDDMDVDSSTEVWAGLGGRKNAAIRAIGTLPGVSSPSLVIASDGDVLAGDAKGGWWRASPDAGGFERIALPDGATDVQAAGTVLVATRLAPRAGERAPTYVSGDAGATWDRFDLGPGAP